MTPSQTGPRFHALRDRLLAEAHARPSTPISAPALATRITTLSGEGAAETDRRHMAALCRKFAASEPGEGARWGLLHAGQWTMRWERHTEVSTWTILRPGTEADLVSFSPTALDLVPRDWLADMPGEVLVAAHAAILRETPARFPFADDDIVAARVGAGPIAIFTDFRAGPDGFTRFVMVDGGAAEGFTGRVLQQLFEVESYRLLALLSFPLALETSKELNRLDAEIDAAAAHVAGEGDVEADRVLVTRLAGLAGEAESLAGRTSYRFAAARAYHGLVQERIEAWDEQAITGRPTLGEFMARRLAPAMRTCASVADRQRAAVERIARTLQMLNTRVEVASEIVNVALLDSMDRRARQQVRLQQTVEGLSVVAISYYAIGLLQYVFKAVSEVAPGLNVTLATGLTAPFVVGAIWWILRRMRAHAVEADKGRGPPPKV